MTSVLNRVRASSGPEIVHIVLEIESEAWAQPLVLCSGYTDLTVTTEDNRTLHAIATAMGVVLPKKDATASQKLRFAVANVRHEIYNLTQQAVNQAKAVTVVYREYLSTDLGQPASNPWRFNVTSVSEKEGTCNIDCGLFDIIDTAYPRRKYDSKFSPALKYL